MSNMFCNELDRICQDYGKGLNNSSLFSFWPAKPLNGSFDVKVKKPKKKQFVSFHTQNLKNKGLQNKVTH